MDKELTFTEMQPGPEPVQVFMPGPSYKPRPIMVSVGGGFYVPFDEYIHRYLDILLAKLDDGVEDED